MRLTSPAVEQAIVRRARQEIARSPLLQQDYGARQRIRRRQRIGKALEATTVSLGGFVLPIALSVLFIGFGRFAADERTPAPLREGNTPDWALVTHSIFLTGFSLLSGISFQQQFRRSKEVSVPAYFPVPDRMYYRWQWQQSCLPFNLYLAVWIYGYYAWSYHFATRGWLLTLAVLLLHWPASLPFLACLPNRRLALLSIIGLVLFLVGMLGSMAGHFIRPVVANYLRLGFCLTPAGWVNALFYYALIQPSLEGWLFLPPLLALSLVTFRRWRKSIAIQEFRALPNGELEAVIEPTARAKIQPAVVGTSPPAVPEAIREKVRRRVYWGDSDQPCPGWLDRIVLPWIGTRDATILEFINGRPPRWTAYAFWSAVGTLICAGFVAIPLEGEAQGFLFLPSMLLLFYLAVEPTDQNQSRSPPRASPLAFGLFPVSYWDFTRVGCKQAVLRILITLPLLTAYGAATAWRLGVSFVSVETIVAKGIFLYLVSQPIGLPIVSQTGSGEVVHPLVRLNRLLILTLLGMIWLASVVLLFVAARPLYDMFAVPEALARPCGFAGAILSSAAIWFFNRWDFYQRKFAWI